jgi:hypothetical protein
MVVPIKHRLLPGSIDLGYSLVSDVRPELAWSARMVEQDGQWVCLDEADSRSVFNDNRCVPLGSKPWYHSANNWMAYTNTEGPLLQVPVTSMPGVEPVRISTAVQQSRDQAFIVIDTHPYDLQDRNSSEVSTEQLVCYQQSLLWIIESFTPTFIRIDQLPLKLLA